MVKLFSSEDVEQNVAQAVEEAKKKRELKDSDEWKVKQEAIEKADKEAEDLMEDIGRLRNAVQALKSQQELIQERNKSVYDALDLIKREIEKKEEVNEIETSEDLVTKVENLSREVDEIKELKEKTSSLEQKIEGYSDTLQTLEDQEFDSGEGTEQEMSELKSEMDKLKQKIDSGSQDNQDVSELKSEIEEVKQKLDTGSSETGEVEEVQEEVKNLKSTIQELTPEELDLDETPQTSELSSSLDALTNRIDKIEDKVSNLSSKKQGSKPEGDTSDLENTIEDLSNRIRKLESKADLENIEISAEDVSYQEIPEELERRLDIIEMDLGVLESQIEKQSTELREEMDLRIKFAENDLRTDFARRTELNGVWDAIEIVSDKQSDIDQFKQEIVQEVKTEIAQEQADASDAEFVERSEFEQLRNNVKQMSDLLLEVARKCLK